jgi:hypothetical protein
MKLNSFERFAVLLVTVWMIFFGYLISSSSHEHHPSSTPQQILTLSETLCNTKMAILASLVIVSILFLVLYLVALKQYEEIIQLYTNYELHLRIDPADPILEKINNECEASKRSWGGKLARLIGDLPQCKEKA